MAINTGAISTIPVEVFASYIVEKLRKENPHFEAAIDESDFVLGGSVVHIPQAGNSPAVVKNRKTFPAVVVQRGDTSVTYPLDVYTTDPVLVSWQEANEISYDKTDSVLSDHVATLIEAVGDNLPYTWVKGLKYNGTTFVADEIPASAKITTTGAATAVNPDDGQTGNRKAFTYKELQTAQAKMNKGGVPKKDRYAMLESYMYQQFLDSLSTNQMAAYQAAADLSKGICGEFAGFKIMERSTVLSFSQAGVLNVPGAALQATDNLASLCWQKRSVAKAKGDIVPFQNANDATYYGDVMSALVKMGGRCRRANWKGIIAIVQGA